MRKNFFYAAALAAMLASCTEKMEQSQPVAEWQGPAVPGETAVTFGAYTQRPVTRGGDAGKLETGPVQTPVDGTVYMSNTGFGVFGYYTDNQDYAGRTIPNFMYNEQVLYDAAKGGWWYEPVKYWPNEYGASASSADQDRVSFFAYAPYVDVEDVATGKVAEDTYGITGFMRNTAAGDPIVKYKMSFDPDQQVDLCWGVVHSDATSWGTLASTQTFVQGMPYTNLEHPADIGQKVKFLFKHATAALNVQVDVDVDVREHEENSRIGKLPSGDVEDNGTTKTKVFVRSVTFGGFAQKGALNLNNEDPNVPRWMNYGGQGTITAADAEYVTVNDGRKNGKEGVTPNAQEKNAFLNPGVIQTGATTDTGVTGSFQNLFKTKTVTSSGSDISAEDQLKQSLYVIPVDGEPLTVTIVYDVETADDNLPTLLSDGVTHGSTIENKITREITFGNDNSGLVGGRMHTVKLHLGLTSVKFEATVSNDWKTNVSGEEWLPANKGTGYYNPNNALTLNSLTAGATAGSKNLPAANDNAKDFTIPGIMTVPAGGTDPVQNILNMSAANASDVSSSNPNVAALVAGTAGTRSAELLEGQGTLNNVSTWRVVPKKSGQTTIKVTSVATGETSTCVITVQAPDLMLGVTSLTLYKFDGDASDAEKGSVPYKINIPVGMELNDEDVASMDVNTTQYWDSSTSSYVNNNDPESHKEDVITVEKTTDGDEKIMKVTPKGLGNATVTVTTKYGAKAQFSVAVNQPTITINGNSDAEQAIIVQKGAIERLNISTSPAINETLTLKSTPSDITHSCFTWNSESNRIEAAADATGTGKLTFQFNGHETENDPKVTMTVIVVDGALDKMKVGESVMESNPMYKMAKYNLAQPTVTGEGGNAMTTYGFVTEHSTNSQYVFTYADAKALGTSGTISINGKNYKLPTKEQQIAVIPTDAAGDAAGSNIFDAAKGTCFKYGTDNSIFYRKAGGDYYAVRNWGAGNTATAWHYKWVSSPCNGLLIESYTLANEISDETTAMALAQSLLPSSNEWNKSKNQSPDASSTTTSLVSRFLPACGYRANGDGSGIADRPVGSSGYYWSSTDGTGSKAFRWSFYSGNMSESFYDQGYAFSVRLFRE